MQVVWWLRLKSSWADVDSQVYSIAPTVVLALPLELLNSLISQWWGGLGWCGGGLSVNMGVQVTQLCYYSLVLLQHYSR